MGEHEQERYMRGRGEGTGGAGRGREGHGEEREGWSKTEITAHCRFLMNTGSNCSLTYFVWIVWFCHAVFNLVFIGMQLWFAKIGWWHFSALQAVLSSRYDSFYACIPLIIHFVFVVTSFVYNLSIKDIIKFRYSLLIFWNPIDDPDCSNFALSWAQLSSCSQNEILVRCLTFYRPALLSIMYLAYSVIYLLGRYLKSTRHLCFLSQLSLNAASPVAVFMLDGFQRVLSSWYFSTWCWETLTPRSETSLTVFI